MRYALLDLALNALHVTYLNLEISGYSSMNTCSVRRWISYRLCVFLPSKCRWNHRQFPTIFGPQFTCLHAELKQKNFPLVSLETRNWVAQFWSDTLSSICANPPILPIGIFQTNYGTQKHITYHFVQCTWTTTFIGGVWRIWLTWSDEIYLSSGRARISISLSIINEAVNRSLSICCCISLGVQQPTNTETSASIERSLWQASACSFCWMRLWGCFG